MSTCSEDGEESYCPGKKDTASLMQSGLKSASGKPIDLSGARLGDMISDPHFNVFPVDKFPSQ
jgi:hypothetical protein